MGGSRSRSLAVGRRLRLLRLRLLLLLAWAGGGGGGGIAWAAEGHTPPEVLTKHGRLLGQRVKVPGAERSVDVFLGIPFAKPPTGSRRFSPPQPAEPWSELRDATSDPPMCLQDPELAAAFSPRKEKGTLRFSEDCLYLNIFTPSRSDKKAKLPVMVWIHGGGLLLGAASSYDGSALAAYEEVVVVTIQYRLGILGFYSTGDENSRGNWGYLDQVEALRWIQNNIVSFGGDPGSVTIFGESAGGCSVSAHVLSPMSKGLFHKAISQSGVALLSALLDAHPEKLAKQIANVAGCPASSSSEMVRCLKGKTEDEILEATLKMEFTRMQVDGDEKHTVFFPAVVDGAFLPKHPEVLLAEKSFNNVPYILGINNHEWGWNIPTVLQYPHFSNGLDKETADRVLRSSEQFTGVAPEDAYLISDEYLKDTRDSRQLRDHFLELFGDVVFLVPGIVTARAHRDAGHPVYFYEFQYRPSAHFGLKPDFVKADHCDEIGFVFGWPFLAEEAPEEEKKLSRTVMKYWANFARNGNPNGAGLVHWPLYDGNEQYLEIDIMQKVAKKLKEKQIGFWTKKLPAKIAESKGGHIEL